MADKPCPHLVAPLTTPSLVGDAYFPARATLQEIFGVPSDAAAVGLALSQTQLNWSKPLFWVQEAKVLKTAGRVFTHGLPRTLRRPVLHVAARNARDVLWAMEEGLKCSALGAVIGELYGNPRALDFTASRRLAAAAERYGTPAFLIRTDAQADLSGARRRWRAESRPSLRHPYDSRAPGMPAWSLDLFRARDMRPGRSEVAYDSATHRLDMVSRPSDGALAQGASRYG